MTVALIILAGLAGLVGIPLAARQATHRWLRRHPARIGRWSDVLPFHGKARCGRCRTAFGYVKAHALIYEGRAADGRITPVTICALCEPCNGELTPGERMGYYEQVWDWMNSGERQYDASELVGIRAAVQLGL